MVLNNFENIIIGYPPGYKTSRRLGLRLMRTVITLRLHHDNKQRP